ncbi:MAG: oligosaccharide flippase family protein [Lachnospiraceae bacterium]|nr:oligosaccharide flippase family protein [Lachnospiraceae bacterium]
MPLQVRASFWFFICSFLQKAITAITTPIFTRLFTSNEFGQFNVFVSWQSILSVFLTLNLCYGFYTAGLVKYEKDHVNFVTSLEGLSLTMIIFWFVTYSCFHAFFNHLFSLSTFQMVCLIGTIWTTTVYCFWAAEERVQYSYKKLTVVTLLVSIVKPLVGIILVIISHDKVSARIAGLFLVELFGFGWIFIYHLKRGGKLFSKYYWKNAILFGLTMVPHYLSQTVLNSSDRIMISRMVSDQAAGIYSLAYSVSMIMNLFNTALTQSVGPWVYQRIKAKEVTEVSTVLFPTIILIALVNLLLISFAPEVVYLFAPKEYYDAIWTIPPVVISVFYIYLYSLFSYVEFYYEKTKYISVATVIAALTNIILNFFGIKIFGYIAAGYTTLLCFALYAIGHYCVMRLIEKDKHDGNSILPGKNLLLLSFGFTLIGLLVSLTYHNIIVRYCFLSICTIVVILKKSWISVIIKKILGLRKNA